MMDALPPYYPETLRGLLRFALIGIALGLILGIFWTELRKSVRYGPTMRQVEREAGSRVRLELPPGAMFEAGLDIKLSHGHVILVAGLLPLGFAWALWAGLLAGGAPVRPGPLKAFLWLYISGASGALILMIYKGLAGFLAVRAGGFDLGAVDAGLFLGSRALRGVCYGLSHSLMAAGAFILIGVLWRSIGARARARALEDPAAGA